MAQQVAKKSCLSTAEEAGDDTNWQAGCRLIAIEQFHGVSFRGDFDCKRSVVI
jgi:hypothetical protein